MQHMPDKEFDQLFRDKFEDAEIAPSANLWANIEQKLEPKRKRSFPIYWMAAASIAIAITAMLVLNKTETIQLRGTADVANAITPIINTNDGATNVLTQVVATPAKTETRVVSTKTLLLKTQTSTTLENNLKNNEEVMQPMIANVRLPIKQQDVKPLDIAPIKEAQIETPIVYAQANTETNITEDNVISEKVAERKGIRNVGDLVNFVVEKVDKREKKIVRFNTDDDDNSSIVGINIGFLKFNKKNK